MKTTPRPGRALWRWVLPLLVAAAGHAGPGDDVTGPFDERAAEHLLNRAGFGARAAEVERVARGGLEAAVRGLLDGPEVPADPFWARRIGPRDMKRRDKLDLLDRAADAEERRRIQREMRADDGRQLAEFREWWIDRMLRGEDPLRERMTLFWHGYFTSSSRDVKSSYEMIVQNRLFREHALGNFGDLLLEVARDPAMLEYLDSATNVRAHPNENFARELFELFTLGVGHFTEKDVTEAARAFTGWADRDGRFRFRRSQHDFGVKRVLGEEGRFTGSDVIAVVLRQERCAEYLAGRLIESFEGRPPAPDRLDEYARLLYEGGYEVRPFLEHLFLDPAFYRDEVVGTRIAGPVDFLVGHARRLGVDPPARLLVSGADALGQRLLDPPNVKGWEGGRAWIHTSSLMLRGNLAGVLLGTVGLDDVLEDWVPGEEERMALGAEAMAAAAEGDPEAREAVAMASELSEDEEEMTPARFGSLIGSLQGARRVRWEPRYHLTSRLLRAGAVRDEDIVAVLCEELLAVPPSAETRAFLLEELAAERERLGVGYRHLLDTGVDVEPALRRLAHLVLSLPEAQLH